MTSAKRMEVTLEMNGEKRPASIRPADTLLDMRGGRIGLSPAV